MSTQLSTILNANDNAIKKIVNIPKQLSLPKDSLISYVMDLKQRMLDMGGTQQSRIRRILKERPPMQFLKKKGNYEYVPTWYSIAVANTIWGTDGWALEYKACKILRTPTDESSTFVAVACVCINVNNSSKKESLGCMVTDMGKEKFDDMKRNVFLMIQQNNANKKMQQDSKRLNSNPNTNRGSANNGMGGNQNLSPRSQNGSTQGGPANNNAGRVNPNSSNTNPNANNAITNNSRTNSNTNTNSNANTNGGNNGTSPRNTTPVNNPTVRIYTDGELNALQTRQNVGMAQYSRSSTTCMKGAVSDSVKRSFSLFGNLFGLFLKDK